MLYRIKIKDQHGTTQDVIFKNKKRAEKFDTDNTDAYHYSLWYEYSGRDGVYTLDDLVKDD